MTPWPTSKVYLTYNAAGQLATIDRYQGGQFVAQSVYTYDSLGRLVSLVDSQGSTVLASYAYSYDSNDPSQPVSTAASLLSSIDPSCAPASARRSQPDRSCLTGPGPVGFSPITSVESVDGTASYSYDPEGQLTGTAYSSNLQSQIPNPPSESFLTIPTATVPTPATSPALTTSCSPTARTHINTMPTATRSMPPTSPPAR